MEKIIEVGSMVKLKDNLRNYEYYGLCAWFGEFDSLKGKFIQVEKKVEVLPNKYVYKLKDVDKMLLVTQEMVQDVVNDFKCERCGKDIETDDLVIVNGKPWCKECAKENFPVCSECGEILTGEIFEYDGKSYCKKCFDEKYFIDSYGNVHLQSEAENIDSQWIFKDDLDELTFVCDRCGKRHLKSKKDTVELNICNDCFENMSYPVNSYHYMDKDDFIVKRMQGEHSKVPTFGFELEVEKVDTDTKYRQKETGLLITQNTDKLFVLENDGSLNDSGFEIISQPMTMRYIKNTGFDKIKTMIDILNRAKWGETKHTGLHIHVGRQCLGDNQDDVINKICVILETFKEEVCAFSRRRPNDYCQFLTHRDNKNKTLKYIKRCRGNLGRYAVLNEQNSETIEFRIFKSTRDLKTLLAALEFVNNIVMVAKNEDITGMTWDDIINYNSDNEYLVDYNKSVNIVSETKICLLSELELHKENYSFKNFLEGKFYMQPFGSDNKYEYMRNFLGNLYSVGMTYHGVYYSLKDCLERKFSDNAKICVKVYNGKMRLVSETSGIDDMQIFEDVYELWIDNPELFKL